MYSRKTLRKLPAMTRRIAREINSIELATRHLKKELELISSNESEVIAWINQQQYFANQVKLERTDCEDCPAVSGQTSLGRGYQY